jgi:CheY-like chemotaxis protein
MYLASRALIVCDNPALSEISRALISPFVRHAHTSADAVTALAMCGRWKPELALIDYHMAPISGAEFARRLRGQQAADWLKTAVVMMTANASRRVVLEAREAGVDQLVLKPLAAEALAFRVGQALAGRGHDPFRANG